MFESPGNELQKCRNNVKTIGIRKIKFIFQNRKIFTSPANEFLLHKSRNNKKM